MNCQKNYFFLALAFFSTSVWALTDQGSGYTGTYEIRTCQDMVDFANIVRGEGFNQNTKANAKVMNAINMTCTSEYPKIGRQNDTYTGTFDGQNYPIKGLKLTSGDQNVGLFAAIGEGAYLKNFVVQDVEITGTVSRPTDGTGDIGSIGGLVGWQNGGTIEGCYVSGTVTGTGRENAVGGIVGNSYNGEIRDCYSHVTVRATGELSFAGGLVGYAYRPCATWEDNFGVTVYSSVFDGSVFATDPTSYAGGVTGNNGERRPFAPDPKEYHDNTNCSQNLTDWDHDYFINDFYDANSADYGVGTGTNADWASYPNNNGGSENNFTKTNVPETFDMDSRHTICLLNEGTWNAETETCENQKSDVWSGGEGGISNGAGVFENGVAKYLIAFDPNGGKYPSGAKTSKNLEMGAAINADNITNPYRRFYTFKGWATSKDASSPSSLGNVAGTKTIYAVWEAATTETLKVYFNKVVGNVTVLDSITVTVNIPADTSEAKQIAAINNAFAAMDPAVVVAKVGGNEDSIYTHDSWARNKDASGKPVFDASGNVTYEPTFTAVLANTLVAQYGSGTGDSILVKVPAADSEADRIAKIMDAIASHDPEINVEKTGGSSDSVYTYSGWQIKKDGSGTAITDGSGNVIYEPTFDVEVKKETIVARFGTDDDDTVLVEVHVTDNDETRFDKIEAALASHDPAITPKKDSTETTVYEYNGTWTVNGDGEYEPQFDESARKYEVTLNVPAAVAETFDKTMEYAYSASGTASLPAANTVPLTEAALAEGFAFEDWFSDEALTSGITEIAAGTTGAQTVYGKVAKDSTFEYEIDGEKKTVTVEVVYGETAEQIITKIVAALDDAVPTKEQTATTDYTYAGTWEVVDGKIVPKFDESAREYTVTLNVPDGATVIPAMTKYAAGTAATLPSANLDGWTFSGWVDGSGTPVTQIAADATGDKSYTAVFTKDITVVYGDGSEDKLTVTIEQDDSETEIVEKIEAALEAENITPTKESSATTDYTYNGEWVQNTSGEYVAQFDESAREYTVTLNVPDGATVIPAMTKYAAGTAATLPSANLDGWTFSGWVDGSGTPVTQIAADATGDKAYTAVFTKNITVVYGEGAGDKLTVEIEQDDSAAEIVEKIEAALEAENITPTKESSATTDYTYNGEWVQNTSGEYEPQFDESAREYTVTLNVPAAVAETFDKTMEYAYSAFGTASLPAANTVPLTEAAAAEGFAFEGWFSDEALTSGITEIAAGTTGAQTVYGKVAKDSTFEYEIDGEKKTVTVEVVYGETAEQIITKIVAALDDAVPTKEQTATTDYTYAGTWEVVDGKIVPKFDESAREYTVTLNVPDGATVIPAMTKYAAGTAATLPSANLDGWTFSGWVDGSGTPVTQIAADATGDKAYTAVFTKNITVVYGEGAGDKLTVEIEQDDSAAEIVEKIEAALEAENITPSKSADADSTYEFNGKWNVDGNTFTAEFEGTLITETVIVKYGEGDGDQIEVIVPKAANDSVRTAVVMDSLQNKGITPTKSADADSTYEFNGKWNVDGNTFTAEFEGTLITETVIVKYGDGAEDQIEVIVPKAANDSVRTAVVMDSLESKGITPTKSADADSTYEFNGKWDVDGNTFTAEFEGSPKYIEVVVGDDTVKVVVPGDTTSGEGGKVVIDIKVVVDGDTINVPVTEGDVLDSAARAALDSIPTKPDTEDSTYEFKGWKPVKDSTGENVLDENGNAIYEPEFEAEVKKETIVVSTDDGKGGTIEIVINVTDSDDDIEKKIEQAFKDNGIPLPTKTDEGEIVFNFDKFVYDNEKGVYVPDFIAKTIFGLTFVMPKKGKLTTDMNSYVFGEKTTLPGAFIEGADEWEFKGWYTKRYGLGDRVKMMLETDCGDKVFYPLFQKTVAYNANGVFGEAEVIYDDNSEKNVTRALERVVPEDYEEDGETYSFSEWVLEDGVYVAKFSVITGIHSVSAPRFSVAVLDRTLAISGARNGAKIAVYDIRGQLRATGVVMNGTQLLELGVPGSYIVRVDNQSTRVNIR